MLFNSYEFLFLFLPATLAGFFVLSGVRRFRIAAAWLALASIFFYGYWNPRYVALLLGSIAVNFGAGMGILRARADGRLRTAHRILVVAVVADLATLGYFKYANFFVENLARLASVDIDIARIVLPIGISFFTFTQIAYLVDTYHGKVRETGFLPYTLFVTFFPHLIAGPVLHHAEMMPQFASRETYRFRLDNFVLGLAFLCLGLFKKVVLADGIQPFVSPVFEAKPGYPLSALEAWGGVLAYTLQLYFDFSGYSDMAIGLSKMVNVDLPLNFNSPYKAANIADFWRRWHMTLSRFLRDYLYIPLGGNRKGTVRRYVNLMLTMMLGGLWHGAGWTFIVWGTLHGLYLIVHQFWGRLRERWGMAVPANASSMGAIASGTLTFISVVVAWVFFRATSLDAAWRVLRGMVGMNGAALPQEWRPLVDWTGLFTFGNLEQFGGTYQLAWVALLLLVVWLCPNSQTLIGRLSHGVVVRGHPRWSWMALGALGFGALLLAAINGSRGSSEFIYFNF
ncbi:MAG TPA: MBOAT family protein [Caldimonas sp.]|nr:MBOAT family protein [Caldimonas sp.]